MPTTGSTDGLQATAPVSPGFRCVLLLIAAAVAAVIVVSAVAPSRAHAQELDDTNIYAEDVERASKALDDAQQRLTDA